MLPSYVVLCRILFFFKQKTAYEMRISDWSSDVCSSDLLAAGRGRVPWGHPTGRRGAGGVDGALFWRQLLSDAVAAERAADGAFQPGDRGAAHHAALSAQSPLDRKSTRLNSSH